MDGIKQYISRSAIETHAIGREIGRCLPKNSILCLSGDLGAGKTTFVKGLAAEITKCSPNDVTSPTFNYLNIYDGETPIYHFDLYRLQTAEEFLHMGFDDFFTLGGICCIEWSERIEKLLPEKVFRIAFSHDGDDRRKIIVIG